MFWGSLSLMAMKSGRKKWKSQSLKISIFSNISSTDYRILTKQAPMFLESTTLSQKLWKFHQNLKTKKSILMGFSNIELRNHDILQFSNDWCWNVANKIPFQMHLSFQESPQ